MKENYKTNFLIRPNNPEMEAKRNLVSVLLDMVISCDDIYCIVPFSMCLITKIKKLKESPLKGRLEVADQTGKLQRTSFPITP
uniref:Uncharacterized protein n=1 Tax=Lepeophtheirus salmonis TaxID=72036 RepID=A0A0K2UZJ9_LEPSM